MENIKKAVMEAIEEIMAEGRYDFQNVPYNSHSDVQRNLGHNPLYVDNGGHSNNDVLSQVSTFDTNGQNFRTNNNIVVSDNKFIIYKIKNFGNDRIESTLSLFGRGAGGEKELRKAIDTLNGVARRNNRPLQYRTVTSDSFKSSSIRTGRMSNTFWEFSLDNGNTWYILKPHPVDSLQPSKLVYKMGESVRRLNEAKDAQFSYDELSSLPSFNAKVNYCRGHLGKPIGNGSSRMVFQISDQHCLKLAKNEKGIAQNVAELDWLKQELECFPKIFEYDNNNQWIVCEYVIPAKVKDFVHCFNMTWDDFCIFIRMCENEYKGRRNTQKFYDMIEGNDLLYDIYRYITDYQAPVGNLMRLANYGMVRRYNKDIIVILDHGLTYDIWNKYYKR